MREDNFQFHIVGAGRGGTSLLAGLLDYHSELEVGFELYSIAYLMGRELPYRGPELFQRRVTAYMAACKQQANRNSNVIWGNKITTEQIFGLEDHNRINIEATIDIFDQFFNNFLEEKKVIFILRDGRACVNSKVQRTGQPLEKACERWNYSVSCYRFFQTRHTNNLCVRFEDLLVRPIETLTEICGFLNVPYEEEMLNGTDNKKMLPGYRRHDIDASKSKSIDVSDAVLQAIYEEMKYCGYL